MKTQKYIMLDYFISAICFLAATAIIILIWSLDLSDQNRMFILNWAAIIGIAYTLFKPYEFFIRPNVATKKPDNE